MTAADSVNWSAQASKFAKRSDPNWDRDVLAALGFTVRIRRLVRVAEPDPARLEELVALGVSGGRS